MRDNLSPRLQRTWRRICIFFALMLAASCEETPPSGTATDAGSPPSIASGPLSALSLPEEVLACGVLARQGDGWLASGRTAIGPSGNGAQDKAAAGVLRSVLQRRFGIGSTAFIAPDGDAHFAAVRTATGDVTVILLTQVVSERQALAKLPADRRSDVAGNAFAYDVAGRTTYANFIGEHLVLTQGAGLFSQHAAFLRQLVRVEHRGGIAVTIALARASDSYRQSLDALAARLTSAPKQAFSLTAQAREWLLVLREVERVELHLTLESGMVGLRATVHPKPAGALHGKLASLTPRPLRLLRAAPADATAALAVSIDAQGPNSWRDAMSEWMTQAALADDKSGQAYREATAALSRESSGDMLLALHPVGGRAAVSALFGLRNIKAAAAVLDKLHAAHDDDGVRALYRALGVEPRATKAAYLIGEVAVDVVTATPLKPDPRKPSVPIHAASGALLHLLTVHTAVMDKSLLRTFGGAGKSTMSAWLKGQVTTTGMPSLREHAAPGAFLLAYADVHRAKGMVRRLGTDEADDGAHATAAADSSAERVIVSLGAQNAQLTVRAEVPQAILADWLRQLRRP